MACHKGSETVASIPGEALSMKSQVLETGASLAQDLAPVKNICAFLQAYHCYADELGTVVDASHYCSHISEGFRQCVIYDSPEKNARLIGVEYMISPKLFESLDSEERKLWHSHQFEVKSGMLVMPPPTDMSGSISIPQAVWDKTECAEMEELITVYGKTFHFWQVDKGHQLPLGMPRLMGSFTEKEGFPNLEKTLGERDKKLGTDWKHLQAIREYIPNPDLHPDADASNVNSKRSRRQEL
ncbi:DUF1264 domain-containing protein [Coprinopsis sp. MPI-PUGE-AT-0042]|nr:DUF1264 domain-containing protein [Coprinopsis sp. MPI-PUGE-AT-0042]